MAGCDRRSMQLEEASALHILLTKWMPTFVTVMYKVDLE